MTTLRRRVAATATLLLLPALAACGFSAQTNKQYQSAWGSDNRDSVVQILNAAIVIPADGSTDGVFVGSFVNNSTSAPATVESLTVSDPVGGSVDPRITLAPNASYKPQPAAQPGDHGIPVTVPASLASGANPADGAYVTVKFVITTDSAQTVTMRVPVFPANAPNSIYAQYVPASSAPASPAASASPTKH